MPPGTAIRQEEPIQPVSMSSVFRTSLALMEIFRDRPAPSFAFVIALAMWAAGFGRIYWPQLAEPESAQACLLPSVIFEPYTGEWRRYLFHAFWPLEPGYIRGFFVSTMLLVQGYTMEYELGTVQFATAFLGLHIACSATLLYFRFVVCHVSMEATLAAMAVVMHRVNPKVHTDGLDKSLRVPFAIEPRWHVWVLQALLLLTSSDFSVALLAHGVGLALGGVLALRDPEVWVAAWRAARARSFEIGAPVHVALLLFSFLFMPLSAPAWPSDWGQALVGGRVLSLAWWRTAFPGTPPTLHLAIAGLLGPEAYFICKVLVSFALPLLLTPFRIWTKFYAGACLLLAMYSMNTPVWRLPHLGFVVLLYCVYAFWRLPSMAISRVHRA